MSSSATDAPAAHPWLGTFQPTEHPADPTASGSAERATAELIEQETRDLGFPAGPRPLHPFVLPADSYRELTTAAVALLDVLRRTLLGAAPDTAGRLAALGTEPDEHDLFLADQPTEDRHCAPMARPDVVIGADGPKFVEVNVSSAVGGSVRTHVVGRQRERPVQVGADRGSDVGHVDSVIVRVRLPATIDSARGKRTAAAMRPPPGGSA